MPWGKWIHTAGEAGEFKGREWRTPKYSQMTVRERQWKNIKKVYLDYAYATDVALRRRLLKMERLEAERPLRRFCNHATTSSNWWEAFPLTCWLVHWTQIEVPSLTTSRNYHLKGGIGREASRRHRRMSHIIWWW